MQDYINQFALLPTRVAQKRTLVQVQLLPFIASKKCAHF
jgi:hypothetical protein